MEINLLNKPFKGILDWMCRKGIIDEIGKNHIRTCYHKDKSKRYIFIGKVSWYYQIKLYKYKSPFTRYWFVTVYKR